MRRSIRRRTRRTGIRRQTDWIPTVAPITTVQNVSPSNPALIALVDEVDVLDKQDHLTVERIVGEFFAIPLENGGNPVPVVWMAAGIIVSDLDNTGGVTSYNPTDPDDAEAAWLWRKSWLWGTTAGIAAPVHAFPITSLDVHVRRKMGQREVLLLCITGFIVPGSSAINDLELGLNIRTLVKLF